MKETSIFQVSVLGVFAIATLAGIFFLATYRPSPDEEIIQVGTINIWGTYDARLINQFLNTMSSGDDSFKTISYSEFSESEFDQDFLEALAEGRSPDLLLLSNSQIHNNINRIISIEPAVINRKNFRDTYLEIAESYFWDDSILGLPFIIDPMIMFWNRSIFANNGLVSPPQYWSEMFSLSENITERDESLNITVGTLAMGEMRNVTNGKKLLMNLALQSKNPITGQLNGQFQALIDGTGNVPSAYPAVQYFTEFSNPSRETYTWNRSLPESERFFLGGNLAMHFAPASHIRPLQLKNPNLNFDISEIPQIEVGTTPAIYADLYGFFIPRGAPDPNRSFLAMNLLTSNDSSTVIANITKLTSARRDFVPDNQEDFTQIFRDSAIVARTFIDPDDELTHNIFQQMIENVTSGRRSIDQALGLANEEINAVINE